MKHKYFQAYVITDKNSNQSYLTTGKKFGAYSAAKVFFSRRDAQNAVDYLNVGNENGFAEICRVASITSSMIDDSQFVHKVTDKAINRGMRV